MHGSNGTHKVVELSNRHVRSDVLAHRDERDSDDGQGLVKVVLLLRIEVVMAVVEHALDLEHVTGACERAHVDEDKRLLPDGRLDRLERLNRRVRSVLPSCARKAASASSCQPSKNETYRGRAIQDRDS